MVPLLLAVLVVVPVFGVPEDIDLVQDDNRHIIGGVATTIGEFPFLVSLKVKKFAGFSLCSGTIITENWVLTAAHCVEEDHVPVGALQIQVRGGSSYYYVEGIVRQATEVISNDYPQDDIALIKVDEPWPFDGMNISIARLPRQDHCPPVGSPATIMGWGVIDLQETDSKIMRKQQVVVISHIFCWVSYFWTFNFVNDKQICTLFAPGKTPTFTYQGDSGGPVLVDGEVVGVVSWGYPPYSLPGVHTRVSAYIDWIEKHVGPLPRAKR